MYREEERSAQLTLLHRMLHAAIARPLRYHLTVHVLAPLSPRTTLTCSLLRSVLPQAGPTRFRLLHLCMTYLRGSHAHGALTDGSCNVAAHTPCSHSPSAAARARV